MHPLGQFFIKQKKLLTIQINVELRKATVVLLTILFSIYISESEAGVIVSRVFIVQGQCYLAKLIMMSKIAFISSEAC